MRILSIPRWWRTIEVPSEKSRFTNRFRSQFGCRLLNHLTALHYIMSPLSLQRRLQNSHAAWVRRFSETCYHHVQLRNLTYCPSRINSVENRGRRQYGGALRIVTKNIKKWGAIILHSWSERQIFTDNCPGVWPEIGQIHYKRSGTSNTIWTFNDWLR